MRAKIALIGAGSVIFAKNLISDVLQMPELSDVTICLMDIDAKRLQVAETIAKKLVAKLKSRVRIEATQSQKKAVQGAKYVLCTIQVGGYKPATVIDFDIPKKYGVQQTIGDTIGIGGVFRGLRTIPVINSIARDIEKYGAPGCILLNYTNPMGMVCSAVSRAVGIPHVGLCHSVQYTSRQLAGFAGIPFDDVTYLVAGINHMAFFLKFEYQGQDAYPMLFKLLEDPAFQSEKVRFEMMRRLGYFVTESSEHQAEYTPYFIHHGDKIIKQFDIPIDEYIRRCESITATWHHSERTLVGEGNDIEVPGRSHEFGSYIIRAKETNIPTVVYGNIPNTGLITNLPNGSCVEVPCFVDSQGLQPTVIGDLPPQLAAICRTNINVIDLTVEAALTLKREHIYHAAMMDPHTAAQLPLDKIWAMCDELIDAHQKIGMLGEYAPVVKGTGRSYAGIGDRVMAKLVPASTLLPSKAAKVKLDLSVENPLPQPQNIAFDVIPSDPSVRPHKLTVKVPARKTIKESFTMALPAVEGQQLALNLASNSAGVLCKGVKLNKRKEFPASVGKTVVIPLELAGFPAGQVSLTPSKTGIKVEGHILDSKASTPESGQQIWHASCLEVYFADDTPGAKITQILCGPQPGKRAPHVESTFGNTAKDIQDTRQAITKMSYEIDFTISWAALGHKTPPKTILFDLVTNLLALGDAHSGGRTSLNGTFGSAMNNSHYAVLEIA